MPLNTGRIIQFNFLSFSSNIYERGRGMGFFRNKQYGENRTHVFSQDVTQLQAIHAREIFPCFDQPDMKGTIESSSILSTMSIFYTQTINYI